jgi:hypothetical protein
MNMYDTFQEVVVSTMYEGEEEGGKVVVIVPSSEDKAEEEARTVSSTCRAERPS